MSVLLQAAALAPDGESFAAPCLRCPRCDGQLDFDEVPARYFAFVPRG